MLVNGVIRICPFAFESLLTTTRASRDWERRKQVLAAQEIDERATAVIRAVIDFHFESDTAARVRLPLCARWSSLNMLT
jgi:hypothetical protein